MSEFSHILQKEIEAARKEAVKSIPENTHHDLVVQNLGSGPQGPKEPRFFRRLKERQIKKLDGLINQYFQYRMLADDPNGDNVKAKFVELEAKWRRQVTNFNNKGRKGYVTDGVKQEDQINPGDGHPFKLMPDAFKDKVEYFIDMEKKQVAAAKRKAEERIAEHWVKVNRHRFYKMYPVRWVLFWIFSGFMEKYYLRKVNRFYRKHLYQE